MNPADAIARYGDLAFRDAADECACPAGRLPFDRTPPCGCWPQEPATIVQFPASGPVPRRQPEPQSQRATATAKDHVAVMRDRFHAGETCKQIGEALGFSASTVSRTLEAAGVSRRRLAAPEVVRDVVALYEAHVPMYKIAARHRMAHRRIRELLVEAGIQIRPRGVPVDRHVESLGRAA